MDNEKLAEAKALMVPLADALRERRRALRLRQSDVADKAGIPAERIVRYETHADVPRGSWLLAWASALGARLVVEGDNPGPAFQGRRVQAQKPQA